MKIKLIVYCMLVFATVKATVAKVNEELVKAVISGDIVLVERLLNNGANPNETFTGLGIVKYAVKMGQFKIATMLLKRGASFHGPLVLEGTFLGDPNHSIVAYLLAQGRAGTEEGKELLITIFERDRSCINSNVWSCWIGFPSNASKETARILLKYGADANAFISNEISFAKGSIITPLFLAICYRQTWAIEVLLDVGADINLKSKIAGIGTLTPLAYALQCGNQPIIELLIQSGASLE